MCCTDANRKPPLVGFSNASATGAAKRGHLTRSAAAATRMALVTIRAVVHVAAHPGVREISRIPATMAAGALKYCVIARIRMARRADALRVAVSHGEPSVIECRARPGSGRVAGLARRREAGGRVVRIRRARVIGLVAAVAGCRQRAGVVAVHVAVRAGNRGVRAGQRERGVVVVERGVSPSGGVVAQVTSCWKARMAHGTQSGIEVGLVAADASGIGRCQ